MRTEIKFCVLLNLLVEDIDATVLSSILLFHVLQAEVRAADLSDTYVSTMSTGPNDEALSLQVDLSEGVIFNGSAAPTTTDVSASNGVVHIIDEVMMPPNVVNFALNNSLFTSLVAALTRADLTTDFVSILSGDGPFTVFAPTDDAFTALLNTDDAWTTLANIPIETLEAVLTYHVVSGSNVHADQLTDNQTVSTLGGDLVTDLSDGARLETASGQSAKIILTDVQGSNGVVHAIDTVLLP